MPVPGGMRFNPRYVDVLPALAAGLRAVRIRRGAHAEVDSPAGTVTIGSLDELPEALSRV